MRGPDSGSDTKTLWPQMVYFAGNVMGAEG